MAFDSKDILAYYAAESRTLLVGPEDDTLEDDSCPDTIRDDRPLDQVYPS